LLDETNKVGGLPLSFVEVARKQIVLVGVGKAQLDDLIDPIINFLKDPIDILEDFLPELTLLLFPVLIERYPFHYQLR
jgi:hypothetical protein